MDSSNNNSAAEANLLGKRKPEDGLVTNSILKKHKETSDDKEAAVVTKKTLFITDLPRNIGISDIIDFFKDVVQVVRVRLIVNRKSVHRLYGFVVFASANEAKKALKMKNGDYMLGQQITLYVPTKEAPHLIPKLCIDHKVWYKDHFQQVSLPIVEDKTPPNFVEQVVFVAHLSPQTRILHIKYFFEDVGEVVSVRLIVNHEGRHVGYGFVEFASANEAKKALEKKNGEYLLDHKIFLQVANTARPPPPKYNLAERLCYEDYLRRVKILIEEDETPPDLAEAVAVREKSLFVDKLSQETEISDIINFFKDVGEVVHVRLIVDNTGEYMGYGFVEFASANEAKKALEKKNGECLHDHEIFLGVAKKAPCPLRPKMCIDHKVWYEDYLGRERLLIEEDEAVEGLDDISDYVEEVVARQKTLFVHNFPLDTTIPNMFIFFKDVEIVRLRLIVDHRGKHVGCGFVEFASAYDTEKALKRNGWDYYVHNGSTCKPPYLGHDISIDVVEMAPYPLRPKYNLAERLWSKVESRVIEEYDLETEPNLRIKEIPKMSGFCGKKIIFSYDD